MTLRVRDFSALMDNVGRFPHLRDDERGTAQPGKSSFFGGLSEHGDTPLQSVVRKIAEEIGITIHSENIAVSEKACIFFARGINGSAPDTAESEPLIVEAEEVGGIRDNSRLLRPSCSTVSWSPE
jgi:8-oxo-dGTP pyrophosphatase MutT (NUDIX family)